MRKRGSLYSSRESFVPLDRRICFLAGADLVFGRPCAQSGSCDEVEGIQRRDAMAPTPPAAGMPMTITDHDDPFSRQVRGRRRQGLARGRIDSDRLVCLSAAAVCRGLALSRCRLLASRSSGIAHSPGIIIGAIYRSALGAAGRYAGPPLMLVVVNKIPRARACSIRRLTWTRIHTGRAFFPSYLSLFQPSRCLLVGGPSDKLVARLFFGLGRRRGLME